MNQPEENSRSTTEDYLELMNEYGIEFEGRILPSKWGEYSEMFEEIRRIGDLRPKEFIEMFPSDDKYLLDKRIMASKLVEESWNCLKAMESEYGWRKDVEFRAFECFDSEVVCHICLKHRWKPKFEAKPIDPAEAERLQRRRERRERRPLCTCTLLQQASVNLDDQCSRMFTGKIDKDINHEDIPEQLKKRLKRRPDRVLGLGVTRTLRRYLPASRAKYCPFRKANVAYPFMVIETKTAENYSATFGSILRQNAFVIRTCLRLQQNLQKDTGIPHQCIVWSFAIMGEEWRLYAAVPNGSKVQIFDLWHGTVLFSEGALQLLLILDYLCDWACEVYRMSIIRCLTGGGPNILNPRLSPSGTDTSSMAGDAELIALRAMSLPSRSSLVPELSNDGMTGLDRNGSPEFPEIELLVQISPATLLDREDIYSWWRWAATEQDLLPWTQKATIRHSNLVELGFLQVTMPEEIHLLEICLKSCFPDLFVKDAARKLLVSLQDDNLAVTTLVKATSWRGNQLDESILEVRALVYFRSGLRSRDWQITRRILCILCSEKAVEGLAQIAKLSPFIHWSSNRSDAAQCKRFLQEINSLNLIRGAQSAGLALMRCQLSLRAVRDNAGSSIYEWIKFSPQRDDGLTEGDLYEIVLRSLKKQEISTPDLLTLYIKKTLFLYIVPVGNGQQEPPATDLEIPNFKTQGVLIKKSKVDWVETTQNFCFLVINEKVRFDDDARLGQLLEESKRAKEWFAIANTNAKIDKGDRALIDQWVQILKGHVPQDTPLG